MKYTCYNTVFDVEDIKSKKDEVMSSVENYIKSDPTLTPARWAMFKRKSWSWLKKAAFTYYAVNHQNYINPLKINNDTYTSN